MRYFGERELEDFRDLLTPSEYKSCKKVKSSRPTWFPLTVDVFIAFLYRVNIQGLFLLYKHFSGNIVYLLTLTFLQAEIARASDEAVEEYMRSTAEKDRTATAVWGVMQIANEKAIKSIKQKDFLKYLAVANPKNGEEFFQQVRATLLAPSKSYFLIIHTFANLVLK